MNRKIAGKSPQYEQQQDQFSAKISEFSHFTNEPPLPFQLQGGGFIICLSGESEVVIDLKRYTLKEWDMAIMLPTSIIQLINPTKDFDGVIMCVGMDMFAKVEIPNRGFYFTAIRENPCISLTEEEGKKMIALRNLLTYMQSDTSNPFRPLIDESVFKIIFYETAAIYEKRAPITKKPYTRDDSIFNSFIQDLFNNYKTNRDLSYYAQLQHITTGHLSKVIKRVTDRNATEWISNYTIINIKAALIDKNKSINAIADEFNFPNSSFFSQYFKKYSGATPKSYREMY